MRNGRNGAWRFVAAVSALVSLAITGHGAAEIVPERTTYLTFTRTVRVPGATLSSGTYIFELVDSFAAPGVVRVSSRDRKMSYFMGFTKAIERPHDLRPDASVTFGETAIGSCAADRRVVADRRARRPQIHLSRVALGIYLKCGCRSSTPASMKMLTVFVKSRSFYGVGPRPKRAGVKAGRKAKKACTKREAEKLPTSLLRR